MLCFQSAATVSRSGKKMCDYQMHCGAAVTKRSTNKHRSTHKHHSLFSEKILRLVYCVHAATVGRSGKIRSQSTLFEDERHNVLIQLAKTRRAAKTQPSPAAVIQSRVEHLDQGAQRSAIVRVLIVTAACEIDEGHEGAHFAP